MIVKGGRASGRTTQLFCEVLVGDKDMLVWCKRPMDMVHGFAKLFPDFIKQIYYTDIILIDGRRIQFCNPDVDYHKEVGFKGEVRYDDIW